MLGLVVSHPGQSGAGDEPRRYNTSLVPPHFCFPPPPFFFSPFLSFFSLSCSVFVFFFSYPFLLLPLRPAGTAPKAARKAHRPKRYFYQLCKLYDVSTLHNAAGVSTRLKHGFPCRPNWVEAPHAKRQAA